MDSSQKALDDFLDDIITVKWGREKQSIDIIDQTLLPTEILRVELDTKEKIWEAIKKLRVRGAPAIGVSAAMGLAVCAGKINTTDQKEFYKEFLNIKEYLASARPTAVNLFWALNRMENVCKANLEKDICTIKNILFEEAWKIREEDVQISRNIGKIGFSLLEKIKKEKGTVNVLTHCNAGTLATAKYGTATAPMYIALENGWQRNDISVFCDETRPLLQGARLTAFELSHAGIKTSVQCDNMASLLMKKKAIDIIFVGCDRVAANGDAANKIGTSALAIIADYYKIPFYVCAPSSTIDKDTLCGEDIPIEMRSDDEIRTMWYNHPMISENIDTSFNPAFDVTDSKLITGIITERGLCSYPYDKSFSDLGLV